jgi:ATP-dependent Lon protease
LALDELDRLAAEAFEGYLVRKDLALQFKGQYPVPTYVGEFLLGRYCATTDSDEITEGLEIVQRMMRERTVRAGEEELFKSRAKESGRVKIIDLLTARLDVATDSYLATLPSLQLKDIRISGELVQQNDRMLTGGFYAEVTLEYEAAMAEGRQPRPFGVESLRPIQLSSRGALETLIEGRRRFDVTNWKHLLLRSVGFEPSKFNERTKDVLLLRMVPFVVRNYNAVELGPRGTGKSHLFQQVSPYAHLISGGKATVARMFVNNATGQRGLVSQYDVICFDEVSGVSFDSKDGVNIMKGYMESGEFSRGRESIRADGGIVLVGNFDVDVERQLRAGHLFGPLPKEMRDDTAFMDRIHAYIPGWDVPKLHPALFTEHFGFVSDFISECWTLLRSVSHVESIQGRLKFGDALSGRDRTAVTKTVDGLLKLLHPNPQMHVEDSEIEWAAKLALECRRRVKEQQKKIGRVEFENTDFSYSLDGGPQRFVTAPDFREHSSSKPVDPEPEKKKPAGTSFGMGEIVDERFEVRERLGEGGFSTVYRVLDRLEGVERALKVFTSDEGYEAVRRELGFLRKVEHPHVLKVIWADQTLDGAWYLVTELVEGELLETYIDGADRLPLDRVLVVGDDLLAALEAIHPDDERIAELKTGELSVAEFAELQELEDAGFVHRDIKPNNLMLTPSGLKVLDFNIASRVGDRVMTRSGTEPYQAPDVGFSTWDVSTDLFAAGVVLYELLCGVHPYPNNWPQVDEQPRDPRQFRADLRADLVAFLVKACAPRSEQRFSNAREMRSALAACGAEEAVQP